MPSIPFPDSSNDFLAEQIELIEHSYRMFLGRNLLANPESRKSIAEQLYYAPFALLSHNTDEDPLFNYSNKTGLTLFEMDWEELIVTPSRFSAEPVNREEREKLLKQVTENGFIDDYEGIRISKSGKRFLIKNAVVWNLHDTSGRYQGQAACFSQWTFLEPKNIS